MLDTLNQQLFTNPNKVFLVIIKVEFLIPSSFQLSSHFAALSLHFFNLLAYQGSVTLNTKYHLKRGSRIHAFMAIFSESL